MMLKYLIEKEFKQIMRNSFLPRMIIMFPFIMMLVIPWVTNLEVKNIKLNVVDNDRSTTSKRLVHEMEASNYFIFKGLSPTYNDALKEVELGNADIIATIPQHYERDIVNNNPTHVLIAANSVNGTKGSMGASYLSNIITPSNAKEPITVINLFNVYQDYKVFMIPALMAILMILFCGFMPALNIVGEKESGTIEQINVTPVSKFAFIAGKLIPYWIIGVIVLSIAILVSYLMFGLQPKGSIFLFYGISIFFILGISARGLLISNYSSTRQQAMFTMFFLIIIIILMSGILTPISSMPEWAQVIAAINPMTYFAEIM